MSVVVLGLALGLNATSPAIASEMNPHMLAADRHFQELVYESRPVFRLAQKGDRRFSLRQKARTERRAEADTGIDVR